MVFLFHSQGCQKPDNPGSGIGYDSQGNMVGYSQINKQNFAKDAAIYSTVFFVLGVILFGVKKKQ
jgi:hypothetical protein